MGHPDLCQPVAAALFAGLHHHPAEAVQGRRARLSDPALGDQRHDPGHTQFDRLFDQPPLPVPFGQGDAQPDGQGQLSLGHHPLQNPDLHFAAPRPMDLPPDLRPLAVKDDHLPSRLGPHHVQQVMRFTARQTDAISRDRRFGKITIAHQALTPRTTLVKSSS